MRISDWSSDVCSSDLAESADVAGEHLHRVERALLDGTERLRVGFERIARPFVEAVFTALEIVIDAALHLRVVAIDGCTQRCRADAAVRGQRFDGVGLAPHLPVVPGLRLPRSGPRTGPHLGVYVMGCDGMGD